MKTAVQILFEEINRIRLEDECENIGAIEFFSLQREAIKEALQKEKEQMADAFYAPTNLAEPKNFDEYYKQKYTDESKNI